MSRSVRKRPYAAYCGGSQKKAKVCGNQIMRRTGRIELRLRLEEAEYLTYDQAMNKWAMPQDGSRGYRPYNADRWPRSWFDWFRWAKMK